MTKTYSEITVLVDMDDTIERLIPAWVDWLNALHDTNVHPDDITEWDIHKFFPSLDKSEVYAPLYDDKFWETVKPREDAVKYLSRLMDMGFNLYICTTSNYQTIKSKLEFVINRYFPFIPWSRVITTHNKQLLNADILVDDAIHNLVGGSYKKILMTVPHNKDYDVSNDDMIRVHDWEEAFYQIIDLANNILEYKHGVQLNENNQKRRNADRLQ